MRKIFISLTVIALIVSIVGTGIIVYIETTLPVSDTPIISGE